MMGKRIALQLSLLMAMVLPFVLVACGGSANQPSAPSDSAVVADPAAPAVGEVVKLSLGHAQPPDNATARAVVAMAQSVKEQTNGLVEITVHPNSALGEEDELLESCMIGTVDMFFGSGSILSGLIPEFLTTDLPFPFATPEEAYAYYDGEMGDYLFERAADMGLVGLSYLENGFRNMTNNIRPIHTPEDMKNLKMRVMNSPVFIQIMTALGASATPIPYGELYSALQQKTVDGQENPIANIYGAKFYEVQQYVTLTRHSYDPNVFLMSAKTLDKLTDEQVAIIKTAALAAAVQSRIDINQEEEEMLRAFEDSGLEVTYLTDAERQLFVDRTKDIYKEFEDEIGAEFMGRYLAAIGRQ